MKESQFKKIEKRKKEIIQNEFQTIQKKKQKMRPYFDIICSHSSLLCCMFFCTRNQVTVEEAYVAGQKVMGRANQRLGKLLSGSPEDLRFRAFFGVSAQVAVTAWSMMEVHMFSPPIPSSSIFCGHLRLCKHIPQRHHSLMFAGGE